MERRRQLYGSGLARQLIEDNCFLSRNTGGNLLDIDANKGSVLNVRGKSIVWNQLYDVAPYSYAGIVIKNEGSFNSINGTAVNGGNIACTISIVQGHKYYVSLYMSEVTSMIYPDIWLYVNNGNTKWNRNSQGGHIFTSNNTTTDLLRCIHWNNGAVADNIKFTMHCFDLTLMFGAGNEPTTVEEFEAWLAQHIGLREYYPYDAGSILNVKMLGIQTTAINSSVLDTNYLDVEHIYGKLNGSGEYIQVFPSGIKSAGSVSDLLNVKNRWADVKVGSVDLGSLNYSKFSDHSFLSNVTGIKAGSELLCATFVSQYNVSYAYLNNKAITRNPYNTAIAIRDDGYDNAESFKSYLVSIPLYYELATPLHYTDLVYINSPYNVDYTPINGEYNCNTSGTENILVKPWGYTLLDYIESNGTQYIDTAYTKAQTKDIEAQISITQITNSFQIFYGLESDTQCALDKNGCWVNYGGVSATTVNLNTWYNTRLDFTNRTLYVDGDTAAIGNEGTNIGAIKIFNNGAYKTYNRIKSFKIHDLNGTLIQNLVPAKRNTDNVIGMYDLISGQFFTNAGTGDFIAGPLIEDCRSIAPIMDIEYTSPIPSYADDNFYGIKWREDQSSLVVERIGKSEYHISLPIQSKMRRCAVADDGTVKYINPNDYTKFEDGTTAHYDGTDGQIMVEIPDYYYEAYQKIEDDVLWNYLKLYPKIKKTNSKKLYFGAFEMMTNEASASGNNQKAFSISMLDLEAMAQSITLGPNYTINRNDIVFKSNVADYRNKSRGASYDNVLGNGLGQARTGITMAAFRTLCQHRGANWSQQYFEAYQSLLRLYFVEYANFNSQAEFNNNRTQDGYKQGGLDSGVTEVNSTQWNTYNSYNSIIQCGVTIPLVNETNIINYEFDINDFGGNTKKVTIKVPSYRGIENPFGHIWKFIDGYIRHTVSDGNSGYIDMIYTCDDISKFTSTFTEGGPDGYKLLVERPMLASGYVSSVLWNKKVFFPKATSANKYYDYCYSTISSASNYCAYAGGFAVNGGYAGLLYFGLGDGVGAAGVFFGSRLLYTPD